MKKITFLLLALVTIMSSHTHSSEPITTSGIIASTLKNGFLYTLYNPPLEQWPLLVALPIAYSTISSSIQEKSLITGGKNFIVESWEATKTMSIATVGALLFGALHNQITARICLEYFTRGFHQRYLENWWRNDFLSPLKDIIHENPDSVNVIGGTWSVLNSLPIGLTLGAALTCCARLGSKNKLSSSEIAKTVGRVMLLTAATSAVAGITGYLLSKNGILHLTADVCTNVSADQMHLFTADAFIHSATLSAGPAIGAGACLWILKKRFWNNITQ